MSNVHWLWSVGQHHILHISCCPGGQHDFGHLIGFGDSQVPVSDCVDADRHCVATTVTTDERSNAVATVAAMQVGLNNFFNLFIVLLRGIPGVQRISGWNVGLPPLGEPFRPLPFTAMKFKNRLRRG